MQVYVEIEAGEAGRQARAIDKDRLSRSRSDKDSFPTYGARTQKVQRCKTANGIICFQSLNIVGVIKSTNFPPLLPIAWLISQSRDN